MVLLSGKKVSFYSIVGCVSMDEKQGNRIEHKPVISLTIKTSSSSFSASASSSFYSALSLYYTKALTGPSQGSVLKKSSLRPDGISAVQGSD